MAGLHSNYTTEPDSFRRVEVISGVARRQRRSEKVRIVDGLRRVTVTVYSFTRPFTADAAPGRCPGPLAALPRACRVPGGSQAGARAPRSIRLPHRGQRAQRRHYRQLIILACKMGTGARPRPVLGTAHQPRDHRVERDITRRRQQVPRPSPPRPGIDGPPSGAGH
jgi:hypothetical protein